MCVTRSVVGGDCEVLRKGVGAHIVEAEEMFEVNKGPYQSPSVQGIDKRQTHGPADHRTRTIGIPRNQRQSP